ncbi:MAG TPA: nicotinate phosphoribosyltransferase [Candidatus Borkfalkia faecipullorum]|uniref:Nicotinate phosphoribosyltransferase n=1 Tax=Candidatus Borkfalkia faecipullorum TaxID=2838510 RepID=A0A9D1V777_9FIRM|nr:nicotinate phosphoribosyltransferase [Candidatus Borkfalkia faecipullorum]
MTRNLTLLTDLYQLTMMDGYLKNGKEKDIAVFDLFFRRNNIITYSVAAGLEQALDYVLNIRFEKQDIEYLRSLGLFDETFLSYLKNFRFTGDVYAVPEGTVVFPEEPIVTVRAPLLEAQFLETALLNIVNHQTLIASKSAKVAYAAKGDSVMEFGLRRAQGPDAGIYGARASVIGGCRSTSNVLAGQKFGIPVAGTHAHSWVMNFPTEYEAFSAYAKMYPDACLLLVDTYDTLHSGVPNAIRVFRELRAAGHEPKGIRLDSGDLAYLSKMARAMLDEAGFPDAIICASGDLDEYLINSLKNQGACINLWGVGTKLITSADMPALGGVYKLSALHTGDSEVPKIKLSDNSDKITNPGFKQVYRIYDNKTGKAEADLIALRDEVFDEKQPLTIFHPKDTWKKTTFTDYTMRPLSRLYIKDGKLLSPLPALTDICTYAEGEKESFWDEYKRPDNPHVYKVDLSQRLFDLKNQLISQIRENHG